jgi:hypothetical protein
MLAHYYDYFPLATKYIYWISYIKYNIQLTDWSYIGYAISINQNYTFKILKYFRHKQLQIDNDIVL